MRAQVAELARSSDAEWVNGAGSTLVGSLGDFRYSWPRECLAQDLPQIDLMGILT